MVLRDTKNVWGIFDDQQIGFQRDQVINLTHALPWFYKLSNRTVPWFYHWSYWT